ncbi:MAG: hypothetical protein KF678_01815 [Phycisphaeraceae bacterium]|nr:hypothetical protein [Phycisphaeraceae bacterium]
MQLNPSQSSPANPPDAPGAPRLSFSRAVDLLAATRGREAGSDPGLERAREAAERYARHALAWIESPDAAEAPGWIDLAPELPEDPGVHVVSRLGQCRDIGPD